MAHLSSGQDINQGFLIYGFIIKMAHSFSGQNINPGFLIKWFYSKDGALIQWSGYQPRVSYKMVL